MSTEQMRQQFEDWWRSEMNVEMFGLHRCNFPMQPADFIQPYACPETQRGWLAWQASRATVVVELPQGGYWAGYDNEHLMESRDVRDAIEAAGLKVKP